MNLISQFFYLCSLVFFSFIDEWPEYQLTPNELIIAHEHMRNDKTSFHVYNYSKARLSYRLLTVTDRPSSLVPSTLSFVVEIYKSFGSVINHGVPTGSHFFLFLFIFFFWNWRFLLKPQFLSDLALSNFLLRKMYSIFTNCVFKLRRLSKVKMKR